MIMRSLKKTLNGRPYSNYAKRHKRWPDKNKTYCSGPSSQKNALLQQCTVFMCGNEAVASFQMVHPASRNSDHKTTNQRLTHISIQIRSIIRLALFVPSISLPVAVPSCCLYYVGNSHPPPLHITPLSQPKSNSRS